MPAGELEGDCKRERRLKGAKDMEEKRTKGPRLHPRSLARSVGKAMGAGKDWREAVAALPKTGRARIHPKKEREEDGGDR